MNLRTVDLNLLVVLDALLTEAHVSRAAKQLNVSQPAVSAALERCRHLFGDPLLERAQGGMRLTPRAEALRAPVKNILQLVTETLSPEPPDLKSMRRTVRILMADVPASPLLSSVLLPKLRETAPLVDLVMLPWNSAPIASELLVKGLCDIVLTSLPSPMDSLRKEPLSNQPFSVAMRCDHPAARVFDLDSWLDYPHLVVSSAGMGRTGVDDHLATLGRERRVGLIVPSFSMVSQMLRDTDFITTLPNFCLPDNQDGALIFLAPPISIPRIPIHLAWDARSDADPLTQHVIGIIKDEMKQSLALAELMGSAASEAASEKELHDTQE